MSKAALEMYVNRINEEIEKSWAFRNEVDRYAHEYIVQKDRVASEIFAQVSALFVEVPDGLIKKLNNLANQYVEDLRVRCETYNQKAKVVNVEVKKTDRGFIATITSKTGTSSVFGVIRHIRAGTANSPLVKLRNAVLTAVLEELKENPTSVKEGENSILENIKGKEVEDKRGRKYRAGGLLDIGHIEEHSISERRRDLTVENLTKKETEKNLKDSFSYSSMYLPALKQEGVRINDLVQILVEQTKKIPTVSSAKTLGTTRLVSVIDESAIENRSKGTTEKEFIQQIENILRKNLEDTDFFNMPGSNSINDNLTGFFITSALKQSKKRPKVTGTYKTPKNTKTKVTGKPLASKQTVTSSEESLGKAVKKPKKVMVRTVTKTGRERNRSLLSILNQTLKKVVAENMILPRLQYRTGRFANSVSVVSVVEGAKGVPDIAYTYMHDPYDVFRMDIGNHLASTTRDPRFIIDLSIRQIAAKFAITKLISRPV